MSKDEYSPKYHRFMQLIVGLGIDSVFALVAIILENFLAVTSIDILGPKTGL